MHTCKTSAYVLFWTLASQMTLCTAWSVECGTAYLFLTSRWVLGCVSGTCALALPENNCRWMGGWIAEMVLCDMHRITHIMTLRYLIAILDDIFYLLFVTVSPLSTIWIIQDPILLPYILGFGAPSFCQETSDSKVHLLTPRWTL